MPGTQVRRPVRDTGKEGCLGHLARAHHLSRAWAGLREENRLSVATWPHEGVTLQAGQQVLGPSEGLSFFSLSS